MNTNIHLYGNDTNTNKCREQKNFREEDRIKPTNLGYGITVSAGVSTPLLVTINGGLESSEFSMSISSSKSSTSVLSGGGGGGLSGGGLCGGGGGGESTPGGGGGGDDSDIHIEDESEYLSEVSKKSKGISFKQDFF